MNIPFPRLLPCLIDSMWFNADTPCDEETELTNLELAHQLWLNSTGQKYMKKIPLGKADHEPMEEEGDVDEEEGNDETDETEESHDDDEEEELRVSIDPSNNYNVLNNDTLDDVNQIIQSEYPDQSELWSQQ